MVLHLQSCFQRRSCMGLLRILILNLPVSVCRKVLRSLDIHIMTFKPNAHNCGRLQVQLMSLYWLSCIWTLPWQFFHVSVELVYGFFDFCHAHTLFSLNHCSDHHGFYRKCWGHGVLWVYILSLFMSIHTGSLALKILSLFILIT